MSKEFINIEELEKFVEKRSVAFISSVNEDGFPNMKAMLAPRKINGLKEFWFSTNTSSMRVSQFRKNNHACIYFYRKGRFNYYGLMLVGIMEVLEYQSSKDMIWHFGDTIYYKGGKTDPDYCVLKFTATKGRYYNNFKTESFDLS